MINSIFIGIVEMRKFCFMSIISRTLITLLIGYSSFTNAVDLNVFCKSTNAEVDCSKEFSEALLEAKLTKEALYLKAGEKFLLSSVDTSNLDLANISIIGEGKAEQRSKIITDKFQLLNISRLTLMNLTIHGLHNEIGDNIQGGNIVLIGSKAQSKPVSDIFISNIAIENSSQDLMAISHATGVTIVNSLFRRSGLGMVIEPLPEGSTDYRPRGSGLLFSNVNDIRITNNKFLEIKKVGIFFSSSSIISNDIIVQDNYFDLLSFEKPTHRYGLKGGVGMYFEQSANFENVNLTNNTILNFSLNGIRMNGKNFTVRNNQINTLECGQAFDGTIGGVAFKAHFLEKATISENCVQNTEAGVLMESWGEIYNVLISKNTVHNPISGVIVEYKGTGVYSEIVVDGNEIYDSQNSAVIFRSFNVASGNTVQNNTIINSFSRGQSTIVSQGPLIFLQKQDNIYLGNNFISGQAHSLRWNYLYLNDVDNSIIKNNFITSLTSEDFDFGGVYIDKNSDDNNFFNITFKGLAVGITDNGNGNVLKSINFNN
jgi:hypothetical protein